MNAFNDPGGKFSSTRIAWFISVLIVMCVWGYTSVINKTFMHFTTGDAMWMATLFGLKVGQSYVESKVDFNKTKPTETTNEQKE